LKYYKCASFYNENREAQYIDETGRNQVKTKYDDVMMNKKLGIKQEITKLFKDFSNSFNFGSESTQILNQVLSQTLSENPYKVRIRQYQHKVSSNKFDYVERIT
jgi:Fe2+ transport system protein B